MLHCYTLVKYFNILILLFKYFALYDACQSVETLSFGSNIEIKCNQTYLIFTETNPNGLHWTFANQSHNCYQQGILKSSINECSVKQIHRNYLYVPLKAIDRNEFACIYCFIDYKPIAPSIRVTQINDYDEGTYSFNITATSLNEHESFEIIWARRIHTTHAYSIEYWFYQTCYYQDIDIIQRNQHSIIFSTEDTHIKRVEFIIRRCTNSCLEIEKCSKEEISDITNKNYFHTPDSLEKIVCDQACLANILPTTTIITINTSIEIFFSSTIQLSHEKETIKSMIVFPLLTVSIVFSFIIVGCLIILKRKSTHSHNTYTKTNSINLDENRQVNDQFQ